MPTAADKRRDFRELHQGGCFAIPNPWDTGTARYLQAQRFSALATTSGGAAFSLGFPDAEGAVPRAAMLAHIRSIVEASDLPISADFESGYAHDSAGVAESVRLCIETGVAGLSIEDATGVRAAPLFPLDEAVARVRAARSAIDESGADVFLTTRAECLLVGVNDLDEVIRRLRAFAGAGADCVFAPGLATPEAITQVVAAVHPVPVNAIASTAPGLGLADFRTLGVRRVSVGSALARVAFAAFAAAARQIAEEGDFTGLSRGTPYGELNDFFRSDRARQSS